MHDRLPFETLRHARGNLVLLASIAFMVMFSRVLFSPLLVAIQTDLGIGAARASRFFLTTSIGYTTSLLINGYVSAHLMHRGTITLSGSLMALGLAIVAVSPSLIFIHMGLVVIGLGGGLYPPSGVSSVTTLIIDRIRGRAVAVHETGPNMAFVLAPVVASLALPLVGWRGILGGAAVLGALLVLAFRTHSVAGQFHGKRPDLHNVTAIVSQVRFWVLMVMFVLAACGTLGVYAILPTYLVQSQGMQLDAVNSALSVSRFAAIGAVFLTGYLVDRLGAGRLIAGVLTFTGILTILVGVLQGPALLVAVLLQPVVISSFFPAALVAISELGPPDIRNVAVSIIVPAANITAAGLYPSILGWLTEQGAADVGFIVTGVLMLSGVLLLGAFWRK